MALISQKTIFHSKQRESPLPIYIGLLLHGETRKRGLVDKLNNPDALHSVQKTFQTQVRALVEAIEAMGNPFVETSSDLVLDTKEIAYEVVETVMGIEKAGREQFELFVEELFIERNKAVMDVIKRNNFPLFSNPRKALSKKRQDVTYLKQNCSLFSQLYISCQVRQGDLDDFFCHENHVYPPSISKFGQLHLGVKSDLTV